MLINGLLDICTLFIIQNEKLFYDSKIGIRR